MSITTPPPPWIATHEAGAACSAPLAQGIAVLREGLPGGPPLTGGLRYRALRSLSRTWRQVRR